ncbi:MAG: hypothetical protein GJ677_07945 [Rhodobacteraceae bacterium]|nr:hypothetical protein [Paracoccaceae bacterium]
MAHPYSKPYVSIIALFALSACSGGGTSNTGPEAFTSVADLPENGTVTFSGKSVTADFIASLDTGEVALTSVNSDADGALSIDLNNRLITAAHISGNGADTSFDTANGDSVVANSGLIGITSAAGDSIAVFIDPTTSTLDHSTFGFWMDGYPRGGHASNANVTGTLGVGSYGVTTAASNMPTSGSATYVGSSIGFAKSSDGDPYVTASDITMTTSDFSTMTINSSNTYGTSLITGDRAMPELNFSGTGSINGSGFDASVTATAASGAVNGQFYGPGAREIGGTFELSGPNTDYIGAFGAK